MSKKLNYYYTNLDNQGRTSYRCLINDSNIITVLNQLDYKQSTNYAMPMQYIATDNDLFRFRTDLIRCNDEISNKLYKSKLHNSQFKINVFNYNTINDAVLKHCIINSDQSKYKESPKINFKEMCVFQNCLSAGLMTIDKSKVGQILKCYSYDFSKYYFNMMKKLQIPICEPKYNAINAINFNKLGFGIYRCKINCSNKQFWNIFNFNKVHHYTHNTIKTLYEYSDVYDISFQLLPTDNKYNYNFVSYNKTISMMKVFRQWFQTCDEMITRCPGNFLVKSYVSQLWGCLCKFKKISVSEDKINDYDWDHLEHIDYNNKYEYYKYKSEHGTYKLIKSDDPFDSKLARLKIFLTEYARLYMFNFISENELANYVIRCQTDSITFNKKFNFKLFDYYPIEEAKSTGNIVFKNLNSYFHVCKKCSCEYKYKDGHIC